jgi:hypothetical protein
MLRCYKPLDFSAASSDPIWGAEAQVNQDEKVPTPQAPSKQDLRKAQAAKEAGYIWRDIGNGFEQNQHGHRRTRNYPST